MRAMVLALAAVSLGGCTVLYSDSSARAHEAARTASSSGSVASSSSASSSTSSSNTTASSTSGTTSSSTSSTSTSGTSATSASSTTGTSSTSTTTTTSTSTSSSSTGGAATFTNLTQGASNPNSSYLQDVAFDPSSGEDLALSDDGNIYTWDASHGWSTGVGISGLAHKLVPTGDGGAWVTKTANGEDFLQLVDLATGNDLRHVGISTGSGWADGALLGAQFDGPFGIAMDGQGNLVVGDQYNNDVRYVDFGSGMVTTIAGSTSQTAGSIDSQGNGGNAARFNAPTDVAVGGPDGSIYVVDSGNCLVRRIEPSSPWNVTTVAGSACCASYDPADNADPRQATFCFMHGIAVDASGTLFVGDQNATGYIIRVVDGAGVSTLGGANSVLDNIGGLRWLGGNQLRVASYGDIWSVTY